VGPSKDNNLQLPAHNNAELVFGLVYGIGTDAEKVAHLLRDYLQQFGYGTRLFRISQHLRSLNLGIEFDDASPVNLMRALMDAGNEARSKANSDEILALSAIKEILDHRPRDEHGDRAASFNVAHVIRSLKRPEEVALLRQIYRPGFYLIGIAADDDEQESFLVKRKGLSSVEARALIERDQDEHELHGQRMRDTFYSSDVFLELRESRYEAQLERFLELIFGHPFITPTREEHAMFMAYASAARSSQVGRQVGSAIATSSGEVIAVGFNEVPSKHGGPYWEGDAEDHRDHKEGSDSNFENRKRIVESIEQKIQGKILDQLKAKELVRFALGHVACASKDTEGLVDRITDSPKSREMYSNSKEVRQLIETSDLKEITEYGRAVHAEMDAILTCARLGMAVYGKCLYTTTFPCHNCTRHIIASGIRKLVYIEPYPKSKAKDLHSDAICFDEEEARKTGKIPFVPFIGIGPRKYLELFSTQLSSGTKVERKGGDGKPVKWEKRGHTGPRIAMEPFNYLEREQKALDENKAKLRVLTEPRENRDGQSTS
jgi:deoxycytidylate deaminase